MDNLEQRVAIVIPVYKAGLTPDERASAETLRQHFSGVPSFLAAPQCLVGAIDEDLSDLETVLFDDECFSSREAYSRLLLTKDFYQRFVEYDFILIFQLDCLLFSEKIAFWCKGGWAYIGAPWFRSATDPTAGLMATGNGGFSLRRVDSAIRVLGSKSLPRYSYSLFATKWLPDLSAVSQTDKAAKALKVIREARRGVAWYTSHYTLNEDKFWGLRARLFDPSFKIAPVEKALEFSFECFPRYCYELNGRRLPFGCHAWAKHDREFWEQFIEVKAGN